MTLDEYVAWAAGIGVNHHAGGREDRVLLEIGLGFASEIGEVAGVLTRWLRDDEWRRDQLADELGDVAYYWARLCGVTGMAPSTLLARSRAHVEWRRAGGPAGGPAAGAAAMTLEEFAAWAVEADGVGPADRPDDHWLWDVGLALIGDAGEVTECLRRLTPEGDGQRERLAGELGDVWRYWTRLCVACGITPADLLTRSRVKIEGRLAVDGRDEERDHMKTHVDIGSKHDLDTLLELNRDYIRSVQTSDVRRFDEILADDFLCSNPDGSLIDRAAFLAQTARPVSISGLEAQDVKVRLMGDFAIIHARTTFVRPDGGVGSGRYTDVWARRQGRWLAVSAHVTRC